MYTFRATKEPQTSRTLPAFSVLYMIESNTMTEEQLEVIKELDAMCERLCEIDPTHGGTREVYYEGYAGVYGK